MTSNSRRILVTAALPYANGPIHFGHLVGAYLPADVFVRFHKMIGSDVIYICGTDEHGVAITKNAEQEKKPYQEYVDHWHGVIRSSLEAFGVQFDWFGRTSRKEPHYPLSLEFFVRLLHNGRVQPRETKQHYCVHDKRFLPDRYVEGTCYKCGAAKARGDECKKCGEWLDAILLIDPKCVQCGRTPEVRPVTQWELLLENFPKTVGGAADDLPGGRAIQRWYDRFATRENLKTNVYSTVVTKLVEGDGLRARPITRDLPWGVPLSDLPDGTVPGLTKEQAADKVLYVWFDAPIGYVSATIEWAAANGKDWRDYWITSTPGDAPATRLLHFLGKDNITFHCVVFPAMLAWQETDAAGWKKVEHALGAVRGPKVGEGFVLPENVPANEFFNFEGKKFSTSDGWYVDLQKFCATYDSDVARFALCRLMPETSDSDFTWKDFQSQVNQLADTFGNFAARVLKFAASYFENKVPDGGSIAPPLARTLTSAAPQVAQAIDRFEFRKAAETFLQQCWAANQYFAEKAPWASRKTDLPTCAATIRECCRALVVLAGIASPFIPKAAQRLWTMLGLEGAPRWPSDLDLEALLPAGHALGTPDILVKKIDDATIAAELEALQHGRKAT